LCWAAVALLAGEIVSGTLVAAQALCRTARLKATANLTRFMVFTSMLRGISAIVEKP
jgi:hypothetical protein